MQVEINKCFLLNIEKNLHRPVFSLSRKKQNSLNSDTLYFVKMMSPSRRLGYSND